MSRAGEFFFFPPVFFRFMSSSRLRAGTLMTWMCCRELTFKKGDAVNIIRQIDNNWYEGEHRGRVGILPISYVEVSLRTVHILMSTLTTFSCVTSPSFVSLFNTHTFTPM